MAERIKQSEDTIRRALSNEIVLASSLGIEILNRKILDTKEEIVNVTKKMKAAAIADPDLPENTEFKELKVRLQFELPRTLADLRDLERKTILFEEKVPGKISFNSTFMARVEYSSVDFEENNFRLLGPIEAGEKASALEDEKVISYLSPLGRAVLGKDLTPGARYTFNTPGGEAVCIIKN